MYVDYKCKVRPKYSRHNLLSLTKRQSSCKILIVYLKADLFEKFYLNLGYIRTRVPYPDNLDNMFYRTSYQKFINIFQNDNFLTANSRNKLWDFVPKRTLSS